MEDANRLNFNRASKRFGLVLGVLISGSFLTGCNTDNIKDMLGAVTGDNSRNSSYPYNRHSNNNLMHLLKFGKYLVDAQDRRKHELASKRALETGQTERWTNPETGSSGQTEVLATQRKRSVREVPVLKDRVEEVPPMQFIGKYYRAKSARIRSGPATNYKVVGRLAQSQVVKVVGKVKNKAWYMISEQGIGSGFVHKSLLSAVGNNEPDEMRGPKKVAPQIRKDQVATKKVEALVECRTVRQTVTLKNGKQKQNETTVCRGPDGWENS